MANFHQINVPASASRFRIVPFYERSYWISPLERISHDIWPLNGYKSCIQSSASEIWRPLCLNRLTTIHQPKKKTAQLGSPHMLWIWCGSTHFTPLAEDTCVATCYSVWTRDQPLGLRSSHIIYLLFRLVRIILNIPQRFPNIFEGFIFKTK